MKKLLIFFVVLTLSTFLFALDTYSVNGEIWQAVNALCISNGVLPPSSVSPVSSHEIINALHRVSQKPLSRDEQALFDRVCSLLDNDHILESGSVAMDPGVVISPELYLHTKELESPQDYAYDVKDMKSFLTVKSDLFLGPYVFANADYLFISPGLESQYNKVFGSNWSKLFDFQHEGIFNASFVAGNEYIYGGIFRTRQSMGYGKTGNLMVADNFSRQDFIRLHLMTKWFDYTLNISHFDQSELTDSPSVVKLKNTKFNGMHQFQAVHRFEAKIMDVARLVLQESTIMNISSAFDFRMLNPFIFFHGLYNYSESINYEPGKNEDEANNYVALELGFTGVPHLAFNLQVLVDQIQLQAERNNSPGSLAPQAFGFLWNIESPWIVGSHWLNAWYEGVMITPYTYLNLKKEGDKYNTNLDMISGYHNWNQDEVGYLGYKYGGDSLVNAIGVDFGIPGLYKISSSFTYMIHGKYGYGYQTIIPQRGLEHVNDMLFVGVGIRNAEHRFILSLNADVTVIDGLEFSTGISYIGAINHRCVKGKTLNDLQFKIAVTFDPVDMFL